MKKTASARFAIESWDEHPFDEGENLPKLTRVVVRKTFTGDIAGQGYLEYVMMSRGDGTATFMGFERIAGQLDDNSGSFVLRRTGVYEDGLAKETYSVVAGSGTGDLEHLTGEGSSALGHGMEHSMTLDYEME